MTVTVSGVLMRHDGAAAQYDDYGRLVDAHSVDVDDLRIDVDRLPVDVDHNGDEVGEVVHVERTAWGDIHAVAVCDLDELADLDRPVYFSATTRSYTRRRPDSVSWVGNRPELLAVALTFSPATLGLTPVRVTAGDVRSSADRYCWPMSWQQNDLLMRASQLAGTCYRPARLQLHDRRPPPAPTWEPTAWSPQRLQYRSARAGDVQRASRIIDIIAVPHDTPTTVYERGRTIVETVVRGAFASVIGSNRRIAVNRDHDGTRLVGQAKHLDPYDPVGLVAELHIARTNLGDETLELAADGVLDASVAMVVPPGGAVEDHRSRRITRAELAHIALTPDPAYLGAVTLGVRSYA